jgi:hypothetical protein
MGTLLLLLLLLLPWLRLPPPLRLCSTQATTMPEQALRTLRPAAWAL